MKNNEILKTAEQGGDLCPQNRRLIQLKSNA